MGISKTKIVLDADVIIHFSKGGLLHLLPKILPEFQFIVLDIVKNELPASISAEVDNQIRWLHNISEEIFGNTSEQRREFARLTSTTGMALGRGESACMVYCLYNHDVVGSSNTRDVATYCDEHNIIYLTTNDFLFYGICRGVITKKMLPNLFQLSGQKEVSLPSWISTHISAQRFSYYKQCENKYNSLI